MFARRWPIITREGPAAIASSYASLKDEVESRLYSNRWVKGTILARQTILYKRNVHYMYMHTLQNYCYNIACYIHVWEKQDCHIILRFCIVHACTCLPSCMHAWLNEWGHTARSIGSDVSHGWSTEYTHQYPISCSALSGSSKHQGIPPISNFRRNAFEIEEYIACHTPLLSGCLPSVTMGLLRHWEWFGSLMMLKRFSASINTIL